MACVTNRNLVSMICWMSFNQKQVQLRDLIFQELQLSITEQFCFTDDYVIYPKKH